MLIRLNVLPDVLLDDLLAGAEAEAAVLVAGAMPLAQSTCVGPLVIYKISAGCESDFQIEVTVSKLRGRGNPRGRSLWQPM